MLLFLMLAACVPASAGKLDIVFGPMGKSAQAGSQITIPIYFNNLEHHPVMVEPARALTFHLTTDEETQKIVAQLADIDICSSPVQIKAKQFLKVNYILALPQDVRGMVYLSSAQLNDIGRHLMVTAPAAGEKLRFAWLPHTDDDPMDNLIQLYQPYVQNLSYYKSMYFLVGTCTELSKFQLSLKYRFFNPDKAYTQNHPWIRGFHFGYTQTSFWDLESDSAPFEDTSYQPELFFISPRLKTQWSALDALLLQTGIRHESNGRGGDVSRSTNTVYVEPTLVFFDEKRRTGLKVTPSIWLYVDNDDETNPDLDRYRGFFNLSVDFGKANSLVVGTDFRWAAEGVSTQVDVTYPLHTLFFSHLDMYIQAQYVDQLAESLINYTKRTQAFRLGLAIVR
jgi:outer membrane phospholipase A